MIFEQDNVIDTSHAHYNLLKSRLIIKHKLQLVNSVMAASVTHAAEVIQS